jgi:peptide/nickel transport system substrate-binding protein
MTNLRPISCQRRMFVSLLVALAAGVVPVAVALARQGNSGEELLTLSGEAGRPRGRLVVSLRAEPKTLNPVVAVDAPSKEVISAMQADLNHINRATQLTAPALAKSWTVSSDGLDYTLKLRQALRFSDGEPSDAEDVVLTLQVYLDEGVHAPQSDLLIAGGKPITVRKIDAQTLVFHFAKPYGVGERVFDGFAILPRHFLAKSYQDGMLGQIGSLSTPAIQWAGLGPFRLKEYAAGERLILEHNPHYWKTDTQGHRLPYLNELVFLFVPSGKQRKNSMTECRRFWRKISA